MTRRGYLVLAVAGLAALVLAWVVLSRGRTPTAIAWDYPAGEAETVTFFVCLETPPCREVGRPVWPAGGLTSFRVDLTAAERAQFLAGRSLHVRACTTAGACSETTITKAP